MDMQALLRECLAELKGLNEREAAGEQVGERRAEIAARLRNTRRPSRFVSEDSSDEVLEAVAKGGGVDPKTGRIVDASGEVSERASQDRLRVAQPSARMGGGTASGASFLADIKATRRGDPRAFERVGKAWLEGTGSTGGFLVSPEQLPGYVEARRATSPLRLRCQTVQVSSDEVWVVTEGNTVTVAHVAEAATKPDSTGSVAQKISTVHKVAGTSHVSDELLADSNGNAAEIVERQFAQQIGIAIDTAIISGTGTGQPTGIRNTAGVAATAVDGQGGAALYNSIVKAVSRIGQRFETVDTVVVHPRDAVKFELATDSTGQYLFPGGIAQRFPGVSLVLDANIPTNLGTGTNESVILVGGFARGAYFFERQALTIDVSSEAAFLSDQTVFRGVERYGFAVVVPGAFEVLTGITP